MADPRIYTHGVVPGIAGLADRFARGLQAGAAAKADREEQRQREEQQQREEEQRQLFQLSENLKKTKQAAAEVPGREPVTKTRANPMYTRETLEDLAEGETPPSAFVQETVLTPEARAVAQMDAGTGSQEAKDRIVGAVWQIATDESRPVDAAAVRDALNAYHTSRFDFGETDFEELGRQLVHLDRQQRAEAAGTGPQAIMEQTRQLAEASGLPPPQAQQIALQQAREAFPNFDPNVRSISDAVTRKLTEVYERMPPDETADAQIDAAYREATKSPANPDGKEPPPGLYRSTPGERAMLQRHLPEADRVERDQMLASFAAKGQSTLDAIGIAERDNKLRYDGYALNLRQAGLPSDSATVRKLISGRPNHLEVRDADIYSALQMAAPELDGSRLHTLATASPEEPGLWSVFYALPPGQQAAASRVFAAFGRGAGKPGSTKDLREAAREAARARRVAQQAQDRESAQAGSPVFPSEPILPILSPQQLQQSMGSPLPSDDEQLGLKSMFELVDTQPRPSL